LKTGKLVLFKQRLKWLSQCNSLIFRLGCTYFIKDDLSQPFLRAWWPRANFTGMDFCFGLRLLWTSFYVLTALVDSPVPTVLVFSWNVDARLQCNNQTRPPRILEWGILRMQTKRDGCGSSIATIELPTKDKNHGGSRRTIAATCCRRVKKENCLARRLIQYWVLLNNLNSSHHTVKGRPCKMHFQHFFPCFGTFLVVAFSAQPLDSLPACAVSNTN
jgi:hypothetical protein